MRPIDADAIRKELVETLKLCDAWMKAGKDDETKVIAQANWFAFLEAKLRLDSAPTIDAVPVVRCKDCKRRKNAKENGKVYWDGYKYYCEIARYGVTDGGFCFYGERKDDES